MYKLENGVEWTSELKNEFKHGIVYGEIIYTNDNGNKVIIDSDNGIKKITLTDDRYVPSLGFIGQATAKMLELELVDRERKYNLENKEFEFKLGVKLNDEYYYINYGKFIVTQSPKTDDTNNTISLIAYDYMTKFNIPYEDRITYPCTMYALLQDVCSQAEVELATFDFANKNFIIENNQFDGKTLRNVLQSIAKSTFNWCRIGQDNKLYLDFKKTGNVQETITMEDYKLDSYKKANEFYGAINKVTFGDDGIKGMEESIEDTDSIILNGVKELVITGNLFAYTTEKRKELIKQGNVLFGLKYMPIQELSMIGLAYLDGNDIIEVESVDGEKIQTRFFSHKIEYNGALSDSVSSGNVSVNEQKYENQNAPIKNKENIGIIVDRASKQITSIVSEIGDRSAKTTTITQDIDGITSQVDKMEQIDDEITGRGTLKTQSAMGTVLYRLDINGYKQYNNYLFSGDEYISDNSVTGG